MKKGFTLVELLMVVAIIGIIAVLAIQKLSGLQDDAKEKVNIANMTRISNGIETYIAAHAEDGAAVLSRFDTMMLRKKYVAQGSATLVKNHENMILYTNTTGNVGIKTMLGTANGYADASDLLFGTYGLTATDISVLERDLGFTEAMTALDEDKALTGYGSDDDLNAYTTQASISDPDTCHAWGTAIYTGMPVCVVNPYASKSRSPVGPDIYRACGYDMSYSVSAKVYINGAATTDSENALQTLMAGDGILLAFGLGERCTLIGNNEAGFDGAPICPVMRDNEYRRYIVLIKLSGSYARGTFTSTKAEFAGIMDANGNVLKNVR